MRKKTLLDDLTWSFVSTSIALKTVWSSGPATTFHKDRRETWPVVATKGAVEWRLCEKKHGAIGKRLRLPWKGKKKNEREKAETKWDETIRKSDSVKKSLANTAVA